jgi:hypothetical protein
VTDARHCALSRSPAGELVERLAGPVADAIRPGLDRLEAVQQRELLGAALYDLTRNAPPIRTAASNACGASMGPARCVVRGT